MEFFSQQKWRTWDVLLRLRTDHTNITHLYLMQGQANLLECEKYKKYHIVKHILVESRKSTATCNKYFNNYNLLNMFASNCSVIKTVAFLQERDIFAKIQTGNGSKQITNKKSTHIYIKIVIAWSSVTSPFGIPIHFLFSFLFFHSFLDEVYRSQSHFFLFHNNNNNNNNTDSSDHKFILDIRAFSQMMKGNLVCFPTQEIIISQVAVSSVQPWLDYSFALKLWYLTM